MHLWRQRAAASYLHYIAMGTITPPLRCIHDKEGTWHDDTGNGYYGGFQADPSFQAAYNPRALSAYGLANNWSIRDQVVMAKRGVAQRGYEPWSTAPACGL